MFTFKAKFLVTADTGDSVPAGAETLNGLTIIPLDSFVKSSASHTAADDDKKKKKDDKKKDDKSKPKPELPKKDTKKEEPKKQDDKKDEEFGLGSTHRVIPDEEMSEYLGRIKNKDKNKLDPYTMPYVHHQNIQIVDGSGKDYDLAALKAKITKRPSTLLKKNEKMQHSDGTATQYYNVGLPALKGLAVNERTGEFVVVDTCPGSGSCKTFCYAMKGSYVMFKDTSMLQTQTLNFLLNNPKAFAARLKAEINMAIVSNEEKGNTVVIRWHDAGDFFSPQYMALAFDVARAFPDNEFYAYTKMAGVANSELPPNFKISFSEGASPAQQKQVDLTKIKHSVVVPKEMFYDLVERGTNGVPLRSKEDGQTIFKGEEAWNELENRLVAKYKIPKKTILSFNDYMEKKKDGELGDIPNYWNVVVPIGGGDNSSNDNLVHGTYLLFH